MARLWKVSRTECMIFVGAFLGVLLLGTINGVLIGILLSFAEVIIRTAKPSTCFLGIQPGHKHFRDLKESSQIHALSGVLVYRFSSNLFFANVQVLKNDIEDHIKPDTKAVILDAGGIGSLDITAADCLKRLHQSLKEKGIRFYMTEHISDVNEQLRKLGLGYLIEEGCVRRTIHIALKDMGINRPYPLEDGVDNGDRSASRKRADNRVQEFVWAFGSDAEKQIERQIEKQIAQLKESGDIENLLHGRWAHMEELDEDEWLEHLRNT
ncbi:MAG: STAS domain-containing protein [Coprococcus sp.]